jgi:probable rRNA maturation factor
MSDPSSTLIFRAGVRGLPRRRLREIAASLQSTVAPGREFCCLLTGDRELQRLNRQFLGHDYPTDVLSFPAPGPDGFIGEMAISTARAREQAREFGHTLEQEIGILMLHGLLHLLGMDHQRDRGRMARAERQYREQLGFPQGLIERAPAARGARA